MYSVDPNKLIKFKIKAGESLLTVKIDRGWTELDIADIGELYINNVPKYKVVSGAAVVRTVAERTPAVYTPSASEVTEGKKRARQSRYKAESDGLYFELRYDEIKAMASGDRTAAEQIWIDAVDQIKTDIPLT